ncbi:MAG: DUF2726 domain-containing protein [Hyphomicrobiales bacterium]|nr:MAG: DUF2726 domain-containing protein [Hyphomicrobiales bacterium]
MEIIYLLAIALCCMVAANYLRPRRRWWRNYRNFRSQRPEAREPMLRAVGPPDSADQLRAVMTAPFTTRRIMSLAEYRIFKEVEAEAQSCRLGHRVFSQTSLGEIIRSDDRTAHSAINSKRIDILVVGPTGLPVLAIEHQGNGHYQGDAAARDAVKKEALRRAGVPYVEMFDADSPEEIRRRVRAILAPKVVS